MSAFALYEAVQWVKRQESEAEHKRALCSELRRQLEVVTKYRDRLIAQRDRAASLIPLRPREERMWARRIGEVEARIEKMQAELSTNQ